jgi:hypothetical protein
MDGMLNIRNLELPFGVTLPEVNSLAFECNAHMSSYMSIEEYYDNFDVDWVSPEEKQKSIATNQVWCAHWYNKTPVGSYKVLGSSLESVIKHLGQIAAD